MKVDVELEPFTPLLRPTYADAHAGAISEVRMEGYEFGHTYVWQGPGLHVTVTFAPLIDVIVVEVLGSPGGSDHPVGQHRGPHRLDYARRQFL